MATYGLLFALALWSGRGAGQSFVINDSGGAVQGHGKALLSSVEDGKATINLNLGLTINGIPVNVGKQGGEGTSPGGEGATPGSEGTAPGGGGTTPGGEGTTPGGEGTTPGGEVTTPGGEGTTPGGEGTTPGGEGTTPGGEGTTPGGKGTTPGGTTGSTEKPEGEETGVFTPTSKGPDPKGPPVPPPEVIPEREGLDAHNYYRAYHDSPPMTLNEELSASAKEYAEVIAQSGTLRHSSREQRPGQGENLAMACSSKKEPTVTQLVKNWYDEVCRPGYRFGSVRSPGGAGHFTQLVWSDSVELGIGVATKDEGRMKCMYLVGRYKPLGNFYTGNDDYNKNVKKGQMFDKDYYCAGNGRFDAVARNGEEPKNSAPQGKVYNLQRPSKQNSFVFAKKEKILSKLHHGTN